MHFAAIYFNTLITLGVYKEWQGCIHINSGFCLVTQVIYVNSLQATSSCWQCPFSRTAGTTDTPFIDEFAEVKLKNWHIIVCKDKRIIAVKGRLDA